MSQEAMIAIVGMACRFPGAHDVDQFWGNLRKGVDAISRFTFEQLVAAGVEPRLAERPDYVPARGVLMNADRFDWSFFGYSPAEAATIEPQQRLMLECASEALDSAAIDPKRYRGWIGVFAGCDFASSSFDPAEPDAALRFLGQEKDFLATRVAYKLGLHGPAVTVQTACSTSLVAVHYGCQSLLSYECDAAIVGGASVFLPQTVGHLYREGDIFSIDGTCRPFDAEASGTVASSGVGLVVLKRLEDALKERDSIIAVIRGSAVNNDGSDKVGYTAPSVKGQSDVISLAMAQARVNADDIGYIEAHGTATRVGDPVEVTALSNAFRQSTDRTAYCWLGAVKSNIGHAGAAAGIAGLIKTACMLKQRELVPTAHFKRPNPLIPFETTPFRVCTEAMPWRAEGPLLAGVSSFGMGGTNTHAVLEAPPAVTRANGHQSLVQLFCLSAASPHALDQVKISLAEAVSTKDVDSQDVAWTLATGRRRFSHRQALVANDANQLAMTLRTSADVVHAQGRGIETIFLFPGQGMLRPGTGSTAYQLFPTFQAVFDKICAQTRDRFGIDLGVLMNPNADPAWFRNTEHQQLGLFALGYALAEQFHSWGIAPRAMLGHSIGEYVAATIAGVWSMEDALALIRERGRAMQATQPGRMIAIPMDADAVAELLSPSENLALAVDGPGQAVMSGTPEAIEAFRARLQNRGISYRLLDTEHAFHSPQMQSAADHLGKAVSATPTQQPKFPFVSNLTGGWITRDQLSDPEYWAAQLCRPVRLTVGIETVLAQGGNLIVELGPGESMIAAVRRHQHWNPLALALPTLGRSPEAEREQVLNVVARLWERQVDIDLEPCFAGLDPRRCSLPPHPFEAHACQTTKRKPKRLSTAETVPDAALTCMRWREVGEGEAGDWAGVIIAGDRSSSMQAWIDRLNSRREGQNVSDRRLQVALDRRQLKNAFKELSRRKEPNSYSLVTLPEPLSLENFELIDVCSQHAEQSGSHLLLIGRELVNFLGNEHIQPQAAALTAWAEHKLNLSPRGGLSLLDLGTAEFPRHLPPFRRPGGFFVWRAHRWWKLNPDSVPLTSEAATPTSKPFAVLASGTQGADLATKLAGQGVKIGAVLDLDRVSRGKDVSPETVAQTLRCDLSSPRLSNRPDLGEHLDTYAAGLIAQFVLRQTNIQPGERTTLQSLYSRIDTLGRFRAFANFFLTTLLERRWLLPCGDSYTVSREIEHQMSQALQREGAMQEIAGICRLLRHCADSYAAVFSGKQQPISVLYPDGDESLLRKCLEQNHLAIGDAEPCLDALACAVRDFHIRRGAGRMAVLEVGAGHGELSWRVLDGWQDRQGVIYHFTDISPLLVRRAQKRAAEHALTGTEFSTFDITRDPLEQGFLPGTFDAILAYNVLHVAPDLHIALRRLRRLLSAGGWLCLVEVTQVPSWVQMVWGLAPGWWDFQDELRHGSPHLEVDGWKRVLGEAGFNHMASLPSSPRADHALIIASVPRHEGGNRLAQYTAELRRQDPDGECAGALYFPDVEHSTVTAQDEEEAVGRWFELRKDPEWAKLQNAWVITKDPKEKSGWKGQMLRRRFDPESNGNAVLWRHLEIADIGSSEVAALPHLLSRQGLPPVLRLKAPLPDIVGNAHNVSAYGSKAEPVVPKPRSSPNKPTDNFSRALEEIWCDVLGVPSANVVDDFFEAGGESLMAIHLIARIRDRVGLQIPVATFLSQPSFGHLVELGRAIHPEYPQEQEKVSANDHLAQARSVRDVVTLRDRGSWLPLFLAAPSTGTSLCYRQLSSLLADEQPCYGIESPGLHDATPPLGCVEEIAAHHIEALQRVCARGPYVLGGWSTGAIVAHEMAHQLEARGEKIHLLLGIEGYVPNSSGRPLITVPSYLLFSLWDRLQAVFGFHWTKNLGGSVQRTGNDLDPSNNGVPRFAAVHAASLRAVLRYVPRPVSCRSVLFSTWKTSRRDRWQKLVGPLYGGGVEIRFSRGEHWTILNEPCVSSLAAELNLVLASLNSSDAVSDSVVAQKKNSASVLMNRCHVEPGEICTASVEGKH
jgi:acyl transferase domain-containing protein/SAM-dependent methyltransferase